MYKPPKVTVVHFQIESGFAGSPGFVNLFHGPDPMDNTTAYTTNSDYNSSFWGGDATSSLGTGGTSSYGVFGDFGW